MIGFSEMYEMLEKKGPGKAISSKGTVYRIEAKNNNIIAFPKSGKVVIHNDCWTKSITCQGTRAGGIYNGSYTIYDWYNEVKNIQKGKQEIIDMLNSSKSPEEIIKGFS
jgi:hypothetical protein